MTLNRKKYFGSLQQWFCYEIEYPYSEETARKHKLRAHYHVQVTWTGSKYRISNATVKIFSEDESCYLEDWPFRRSRKDWERIDRFLEDIPSVEELFADEVFAIEDRLGQLG